MPGLAGKDSWPNKYYHKLHVGKGEKMKIGANKNRGRHCIAPAIIENAHQLIIILLSTRFYRTFVAIVSFVDNSFRKSLFT